MIINITGMKGSGKTTAISYFSNLGFKTIEIYDAYHGLLNSGKLRKRDIIPEGIWDDSYVKAVYEYFLKRTTREIIFMGGLLRTSELDFLKIKDNVVNVNIHVTEDKVRYDRLRIRGRNNEAGYTDEDFKKRDLNRTGKSTDKYSDNNLEQLIQISDIVVENNGALNEFEDKLFGVGCQIGGVVQSGKSWYEQESRYGHNTYAMLSQIEALLGGRKRILASIGKFNTAIVLGCNEGREFDLVPADKIIGIDNNQEVAYHNDKRHIIDCKDILHASGLYDLSLMLRVIGGSKIDTEQALEKSMTLAKQVVVVSVAIAGITPEGKIKDYQSALNGTIGMEEYLVGCKARLLRCSQVTEIKTAFEHYFICRK